MRVYRSFGSLIPPGIRKKTAKRLAYAGKSTPPEQYLGVWITAALTASFTTFVIAAVLLHQPYAIIAAAFVFIFVMFMEYLLLYLRMESR